MKKLLLICIATMVCAIACITFEADLDAAPCTATITISDDSYNFGLCGVGRTSDDESVVITNDSTCESPLEGFGLSITGIDADQFRITANDCPSTFEQSAACNATIVFSPTATGEFNAAQLRAGTATDYSTMGLAGTGAPCIYSLSVADTPHDFGDQGVDTVSEAFGVTITNTGTCEVTNLELGLAGADSAEFELDPGTCGASLAPGESCTARVSFSPESVGNFSAHVRAGADETHQYDGGGLSGMGTAACTYSMTVDAAPHSFGDKLVDTASEAFTVTITNTGTCDLTGLDLKLAGSGADQFDLDDGSCGTTLAAGSSCTAKVTFAPTAGGNFTAKVKVDSVETRASVGPVLSGEGIACTYSLSVSAAQHDFEEQALDTFSDPFDVTITNTGTCGVTSLNARLTGTDASRFTIVPGTCGDTLGPGESCTAGVAFFPDAAGVFSAAVSVDSAETDEATGTALTGTGTDDGILSSATETLRSMIDSDGFSGCNAAASTGAAGRTSSGPASSGLIALMGLVLGAVSVRRRMRSRR